jgi:PKD repeat protein
VREGRPRRGANLRLVRRLVPLAAVAALVWAPAAHAAGPAVAVDATPLSGLAPLPVTLTASGDAASYSWSLGDGTTASGAVVHHVYRHFGRYQAVVTATAGSETSTASVTVTAYSLSLHGRQTLDFGRRALFKGRIRPSAAGLTVALERDGSVVGSARTGPAGRYKIRPRIAAPGTFLAVAGAIQSNSLPVRVRPTLVTKVVGSGIVHSRLAVVARLRPAAAGHLRVRVYRGSRKLRDVVLASPARVPLRTGAPQEYRVRVQVVARQGYTHSRATLHASVFLPGLQLGSRGPSVALLQQDLRAQRYMLKGVTGRFGTDTYEAVLAFQKVHRLARTGSVNGHVWHVLLHSATPRPRHGGPGLHYEVDKTRQVLFDVLDGRVIRVIHVSTGATGNTPVGTFRTYSKTAGFNAKGMYDSQYFIGGFAIHGYADVPPYPASHGCVRIPIWIAPILYATHPLGTTVYVYYS